MLHACKLAPIYPYMENYATLVSW